MFDKSTNRFKAHDMFQEEVSQVVKKQGFEFADISYHLKMTDEHQILLKKNYSVQALFFRFKPDAVVFNQEDLMYLEIKAPLVDYVRPNIAIELMQLISNLIEFNEKKTDIYYIYKDSRVEDKIYSIHISELPKMITEIRIPNKNKDLIEVYKDYIGKYLKGIKFSVTDNNNKGSGDPYCLIPLQKVKEMPSLEEILNAKKNKNDNKEWSQMNNVNLNNKIMCPNSSKCFKINKSCTCKHFDYDESEDLKGNNYRELFCTKKGLWLNQGETDAQFEENNKIKKGYYKQERVIPHPSYQA